MKLDLHALIPGTNHFYWNEVLWLSTWKVHVFPNSNQYVQLIQITNTLEHIRALFLQPVVITSGLRPGEYNSIIGGVFNSYHTLGMAIDFYVVGYQGPNGCNFVRERILTGNHLERLKIRMEDKVDSNWIHIDLGTPGKSGRFFKP